MFGMARERALLYNMGRPNFPRFSEPLFFDAHER